MWWRLDVVAGPGRPAISGRRSGPDEASAGSRLGTRGEVDSVGATARVDPGGAWA